MLPHCIRLILDDTLSGVFRTCLNPTVGRGEIQRVGLTFLGIIGEFGLQGTSGGASPTWCSKQEWCISKPVEIHYECLFRCLWLVLASPQLADSNSLVWIISGCQEYSVSKVCVLNMAQMNSCPQVLNLLSFQLRVSGNVPTGSPLLPLFLIISHRADSLPMALWNAEIPIWFMTRDLLIKDTYFPEVLMQTKNSFHRLLEEKKNHNFHSPCSISLTICSQCLSAQQPRLQQIPYFSLAK